MWQIAQTQAAGARRERCRLDASVVLNTENLALAALTDAEFFERRAQKILVRDIVDFSGFFDEIIEGGLSHIDWGVGRSGQR